jgi:hypothetical protein
VERHDVADVHLTNELRVESWGVLAGKIKGEVLNPIHSQPTTLNCSRHPLLLERSSA